LGDHNITSNTPVATRPLPEETNQEEGLLGGHGCMDACCCSQTLTLDWDMTTTPSLKWSRHQSEVLLGPPPPRQFLIPFHHSATCITLPSLEIQYYPGTSGGMRISEKKTLFPMTTTTSPDDDAGLIHVHGLLSRLNLHNSTHFPSGLS